MNRRGIVIVCGTALLIAAAAVVALRERQQALLEAPVAQTPAEVRVKAVERKTEPVSEGEEAAVSGAVAIVCGEDAATADRYEARNDALRSIARRRDLPKGDVAALMAYLRRVDNAMRVERVAALKNDVMNLLRNQEPPVEGLAETLIAMIEGRPVAGFGRSGRAGVPPPAADGDGTPSLPARSRDTDGDGTPSLLCARRLVADASLGRDRAQGAHDRRRALGTVVGGCLFLRRHSPFTHRVQLQVGIVGVCDDEPRRGL